MILYNFIDNNHWVILAVSVLTATCFLIAQFRKDRANIEQYEKHYRD